MTQEQRRRALEDAIGEDEEVYWALETGTPIAGETLDALIAAVDATRAVSPVEAAAQDLLVALEFMVNVSRSSPGFSAMARQQAEAAIAKACGVQP